MSLSLLYAYTDCMEAGKHAGEEDRSPLSVRLDPALRQRFKAQCALEGKSMQDVVAEYIEWWTQRREESR